MSADDHQSRTRLFVRLGVATTATAVAIGLTVAIAPSAAAVPAPPPNPSQSEIQAGEQHAATVAANVGSLSAEVSATQAKIQRLRDAMELKAELAMKARVDVQMADMHADDAQQAAKQAQQAVTEAAQAVTASQQAAASFVAASYRQGSRPGRLMTLLGADSIGELAARQDMIEQISSNQTQVLDELQSARTDKANKAAQAREAASAAQAAADAAEQARQQADDAQQAAEQTFSEGQQQLQALQDKLTQQTDAYQQALNHVATLKGQRAQYQHWLQQQQAEQAQMARQTAAFEKRAAELAKDKQLFENNKKQESKNRAVALKKEKQRQAKLRKKQEELKAEGKDPGQATLGNRGEQVVQAALKYLGTPYAWGGGTAKGPSRGIHDGGVADRYGDYKKIGFDCSGLALYAWAQVGVYLPHYSAYQYNYGTHVSRDNLQPGDLVFYAYNTSNPATIHHVAIYMGHGKMIQAPQSGEVVKISPMRWRGYIGAARPGK